MNIDAIITAKRQEYFSGTVLLDKLLRDAIQEGRDDVLQTLEAVETARDEYKELSEGQKATIQKQKQKIADLEISIKKQGAEHETAFNAVVEKYNQETKAMQDQNAGLKKEITKLRSANKKM